MGKQGGQGRTEVSFFPSAPGLRAVSYFSFQSFSTRNHACERRVRDKPGHNGREGKISLLVLIHHLNVVAGNRTGLDEN